MLGFGATGQFAIGQVDTTATAEFIGPDKYMQALSEPARFRQGLLAGRQQFAAFNPQPLVSFSWFEALAEPARKFPRSPAALAPAFFFQPAPSPFVATGWFQALTEPVRFRPGLKVSEQQFLAYQVNPTTVTPFAWFAALAEPVRKKPGLAPALEQFFTTDTAVIPVSRLIEWFMALSEPVRFRPGLKAALQQFLAHPPQLRPNPTTTGVLNALETKDTFLGGARVFNRVVSGEIGVIQNNFSGGEVGVVQHALSSGTSGVIAPVTAPVSGSAVTPITTAHISIRII